jgi:O-antigen/teichoic acid export membrane protein
MTTAQLRGTSRRTLALNLRSAGVATTIQYLTYLAVAPVVFATAGEATFGAWATVSSLLAVGALADAGLRLELARRVAEAAGASDAERLRRTVHEGTTLLAWVAGVVFVIGMIAAPLVRSFAFPNGVVGLSGGEADLLLRATFVLLAVSLLADGYFAVLRGIQRADVETNSRTVGLIVGAAVSIIGLEVGWGIWALLAGAAAMDAVGIVVQSFGVRRLIPEVPFRVVSLRSTAWRHLLGFSSLALLSQLSDVVDSQWDKIMLSRYVGSNAVAGFQIGTTIVLQGKALALLPVAPLLVAIAEFRLHDRARIYGLVRLLSSATFAMGSLALSGVVVFAPAFFRVWLGQELPTAVTSARLFTIAVGLNLLVAPLAYRALAEGRHRLTAISATTNIVVNLVASFALTLTIGFKGPLYGSILGNAVGVTILMVLMRNHVHGRELFSAWKAVLVGCVAAAAGVLAGAETLDSWVTLGLGVAVFAAVFGPILCWVEHVPVRDLLRRDAALVA